MEEQHPIPQQISAYQFRLVGDMTLKQFFQVAGGALIALLIYSSSFASYIKWPLIFFSFLMGVALAFFPLQDRPLSKWIILFLKALYSPALHAWRTSPAKPNFFQPEPQLDKTLSPAETVEATLEKTVPIIPEEAPLSVLEQKEKDFLNKVSQQLTTQAPLIPRRPVVTTVRPQIIAGEITIPKAAPPPIVKQEFRPQATQTPLVQTSYNAGASSGLITPMAKTVSAPAQKAQFSAEASPPMPPVKENVVVGQVLDSNG